MKTATRRLALPLVAAMTLTGLATTVASAAPAAPADQLLSASSTVTPADTQGGIFNANSGKALEIENSQLTDGAQAQQWTYYGIPTQQWVLHWVGDSYEIRNVNSGKCLEIENSQLIDGARAQQWTCVGIPTQHWDVKGQAGIPRAIVNHNSGKCLEIENSQLIDGAHAQQWTCVGIATQQWNF